MFAVRRDPLAIVDVLPWLCSLVFAIGLVVAALYFLRFLRHWQAGDPNDEATLRARFKELREQGELTEREYREVQITLADQMRRRAEEEEANNE